MDQVFIGAVHSPGAEPELALFLDEGAAQAWCRAIHEQAGLPVDDRGLVVPAHRAGLPGQVWATYYTLDLPAGLVVADRELVAAAQLVAGRTCDCGRPYPSDVAALQAAVARAR